MPQNCPLPVVGTTLVRLCDFSLTNANIFNGLSALQTYYKINMGFDKGNKQGIHLNGRITGSDYLDSVQSKMGYN